MKCYLCFVVLDSLSLSLPLYLSYSPSLSLFLSFSCQWLKGSSGAICHSDILPLLVTPDSPTSSHTAPYQLQLCPVISLACTNIAMTRISDDYFAFVSSQNEQSSLSVCDCKYVTEHACVTVKETPPTKLASSKSLNVCVLITHAFLSFSLTVPSLTHSTFVSSCLAVPCLFPSVVFL